jgi:hypothetical protein
MQSVYVVYRLSPDIKDSFLEIKGIFKSKNEAEKWREIVWEKLKQETGVNEYILMDTTEE